MAATLVGLQFSASLGKAWPPKQHGTLLIELDLTAARGPIKCSHTGGDVWCLPDGGSSAAALAASPAVMAAGVGAGAAPPPIKCNAWDSKGRNPAMNVYVHLYPPGSAGGFADEPPPRCKLGVLIQHALPRLAQRVGGYGQVALDWVTWVAEAGVNGAPMPGTVAPFGMPNPAHWLLLQELAKEKETGAGTTVVVRTDPVEDAALRRAKETLVAAAGFFGPEAVAKVTRLTVRKLYQREYHFFDSDGKDVADSRRHALEWAVGLARVEQVLSTNPEARAKLSERLTVPPGSAAGAGAGATAAQQRRRVRATTGGSTGRRVLLSAGSRSFPSADSGQLSDAAAAAAAAVAGMLQGPALPPLAVSLARPATREGNVSMPQPDTSAAGAQQQQQLLSLLSQVQLPTMPQPASPQQQQQQHQHQQTVLVSQGLMLQHPAERQELPPLMSDALGLHASQPLLALSQPFLSSLEAGPLAQTPSMVPDAHTASALQPQPDPEQQQEPQQQQQQAEQQAEQRQGLSQLPLPDPSQLPPPGEVHGAGLSDILGPPHGPPSWLGPDVQLCAAVPARNTGGDSPLSEVEQPSPTRTDPPAQRHPCEEHPHPAQQAQQAGQPQQQAQQQAQQTQQQVQAEQQAQNRAPPAAAAMSTQAAAAPAQARAVAGRACPDHALPGPCKRPRLELQLLPPGSASVAAMLPVAGTPRPASTHGAAHDPALLATALAASAGARVGEELVPLDTVLEAWEAHDRVNRQLAQAQQLLEQRQGEVAELERKLSAALSQLAATRAAPSSPRAAAAAAIPAPAAAATMAAAAAVQAQLTDLRVLLPRSVRLQLSCLLPQQPELQQHAASVCDLASQAVEAALSAYADSLHGAAAASTPSMPS